MRVVGQLEGLAEVSERESVDLNVRSVVSNLCLPEPATSVR